MADEFTFLDEFLREYAATEDKQDEDTEGGSLSPSYQFGLAETETLLSSSSASQDETSSNQSSAFTIGTKARTKRRKFSSKEERRLVQNAQATTRRLRYRQKLADEKETLNQQEAELVNRLNELKLARAVKEEQIKQNDSMALSMWRAVALREKEKRIEAEAKQRELKQAVVNKATLIHEMNELLKYRQEAKKSETNTSTRGMLDGAMLYKTWLGEVDFLYAQTDEIIRKVEFKMAWPMGYKAVRRVDQGVEYFDSADGTVMPYSFERMCHAVSWLMMADPEGIEKDEPVHNAENTAAIKYHLKCRLKDGNSAKIVAYNVTRRYAEANRIVFVWRALYEGHDDLSGFHTDEKGWFIVRPSMTVSSVDGTSSSDESSTILESYTRFVPVGVGRPATCKRKTDRFASILAKAGEEEIKGIMAMLEKALHGDKAASFPKLAIRE